MSAGVWNFAMPTVTSSAGWDSVGAAMTTESARVAPATAMGPSAAEASETQPDTTGSRRHRAATPAAKRCV